MSGVSRSALVLGLFGTHFLGVAGQAALEDCLETDPTWPASCTGFKSPEEYGEIFLSAARYNPTERPVCSTDPNAPTHVETLFEVLQVGTVNSGTGQVSINGFWNMRWTDTRLAFNSTANGGCRDKIVVPSKYVKQVWKPEVYIKNIAAGDRIGAGASLKIHPNGVVVFTEHLQIVVEGSFNRARLPVDDFVGKIKISPVAATADTLRLLPYDGTPGCSECGKGLYVIKNDEHPEWFWTAPLVSEGQRHTGGKVSSSNGKDILTFYWQMERKPEYFFWQAVFPAQLFNLISYIQFWILPGVAPARAFIAVIPVLILHNLSHQVYTAVPKGGGSVWLADYLVCSTLLCVLATIEFGIVQVCTTVETARQERTTAFRAQQAAAQKTFALAKEQGIPLSDVVEKCKPQKGEGPDGKVVMKKSDAAKEFGVDESMLNFLVYTDDLYNSFDADGSGHLNAEEVRMVLVNFNLYADTESVAEIMCMLIRDEGTISPEDPMEARVTFGLFLKLIISFNKYRINHSIKGCLFRPSVLRRTFQAMSPVHAVDYIFRFLFPVLLVLQLVIFFSIRDLYG